MGNREGYHRPHGPWRPTAAQRRVLDALADGLTNAEIAVRLGLSPETVKWHVSELLAKTATADRDAVVRWWQQRREDHTPALLPWPPRLLIGGAAVAGIAVLAIVAGLVGTDGSRDASPTPQPLLAGAGIDAPPEATPTPDSGPAPPCDLPLPPDFAVVSADDLRSEGLIEVGPVVGSAACQLRVSNRDDRTVVWLADKGVLGADLSSGLAPRTVGAETVRHGQIGRFSFLSGTTALFLDVRVAADDSVAAAALDRTVALSRTDEDGTFLILDVSGTSGGVRRRAALSSDGILFVEPWPIPSSAVLAEWTGERIATQGLRELMTLDLSPSTDFAFTSCDQETSLCTVVYRPYSERLRAPLDAHLRCLPPAELESDLDGKLAGVIELDAGDLVLRFRQVFATSPGAATLSCDPREVRRGEVISGHDHFTISALAPDGSPRSVVIAGDGTLYVGKVKVRLGCPCTSGG